MPYSLAELTPAQLDMLVLDCEHALDRNARDMVREGDPEAAAQIRAAVATTLAILEKVVPFVPEDKRAAILALIKRHGA
jgi:hypothetical protein